MDYKEIYNTINEGWVFFSALNLTEYSDKIYELLGNLMFETDLTIIQEEIENAGIDLQRIENLLERAKKIDRFKWIFYKDWQTFRNGVPVHPQTRKPFH